MKPRIEPNMPSPLVIGVDIGKDVLQLIGFGIWLSKTPLRSCRRVTLEAWIGEGGRN